MDKFTAFFRNEGTRCVDPTISIKKDTLQYVSTIDGVVHAHANLTQVNGGALVGGGTVNGLWDLATGKAVNGVAGLNLVMSTGFPLS
jgi:hypothetical protein